LYKAKEEHCAVLLFLGHRSSSLLLVITITLIFVKIVYLFYACSNRNIKLNNIVTCMGDYRRGFTLEIGFIDHFNRQLVITINYSAIADLHTLQITSLLQSPLVVSW
jgi:hypothetical protein